MMEFSLITAGFLVFCGVSIAWDYYKPSRFRKGYHNTKRRDGGGYGGGDNYSDSGGGCDGGG